MKIGKKAIGVVALVTAMVVLQLAVAPTPAMARLPRASNDTIVMVTEEGVLKRRYYCGECPCSNSQCTCMSGSCFIIRWSRDVPHHCRFVFILSCVLLLSFEISVPCQKCRRRSRSDCVAYKDRDEGLICTCWIKHVVNASQNLSCPQMELGSDDWVSCGRIRPFRFKS
jgi:hypothetical protein